MLKHLNTWSTQWRLSLTALAIITTFLTWNYDHLALAAQILALFSIWPQFYAVTKGEKTNNISLSTMIALIIIYQIYSLYGLQMDKWFVYLPNSIFSLMVLRILWDTLSIKNLLSLGCSLFLIWIVYGYIYFTPNLATLLLTPTHANTTAFIAGILSCIIFWPQSFKIIKNKCSGGVSIEMYLSEILLMFLWACWGFWGIFILEGEGYDSHLTFSLLSMAAVITVIYNIIKHHPEYRKEKAS